MFRKYSSNNKSDFKRDIPEYPDEKIVEILKQRDYYQPEAKDLAVEEAIKRKIIYSEQDLFSAEFKVEELNRSLFPTIRDSKIQNNIRKSIARSLVICGIIPTVYGLVQFNLGNKIEGVIIVVFGLFWIFNSSQLIKAYNKAFVLLLLAGAILATTTIYIKLAVAKSFVFMDFFLLTALLLLIVYGLLFLKRVSEN